ncbi:hypothetical protein ACRE_025800 [Hapsidospora chrysogenum ATCC 11550]|uniref:Uncharacterized protein n=1 Tax=Hapsidospora chrysogenum (strain ATCC 11550 / CBS 779.69 / DSM 880 / IAM 14645 / JCM 23072 / IMI 49137) TaxID=857340 RepID=A0A086TB07_HAPC1|nr:hypothetical protein ACRE_025800 [Hapsidospora chrysogenum ATCC 11550]
MRITGLLSSLLAATTLVDSVWSAAVTQDVGLVPRNVEVVPGDRSLTRRDRSQAKEYYNWLTKKWCGGRPSSKAKRAFVAEDSALAGYEGSTLETGGLSTCMGLVVVGDKKSSNKDDPAVTHFMAHIIVGEKKGWRELKAWMDQYTGKLKNLRSFVSVAWINNEIAQQLLEEDQEEGDSPLTQDFIEGYVKHLGDFYSNIQSRLNKRAPIVKHVFHDPMTVNSMQSMGDGTVKVNGHVINDGI